MIGFRNPWWLSALLISALIELAPAPARADITYNFNNGNDNGLTRYDPLAPYGSNSTFTFPVLGPGNDGYQLSPGHRPTPTTLVNRGSAPSRRMRPSPTFARAWTS
jgi:hypothetical protein